MVNKFDGIIVGVGTLDLSRAAIAWAMQQAALEGCAVRLAHVVDWNTAAHAALLNSPEAWRAEEGEVGGPINEELAPAVAFAETCAPGVPVEARSYEGATVAVLRRLSRRARLMVIGSRNFGALRSALVGSTAVGLARSSRAPFVVVRGDQASSGSAPVTVGVQFGPRSETVLAAAFRFASLRQRPLHVVTCWEPLYYAPRHPSFRDEAAVREHAALWLSEAIADGLKQYPNVAVDHTLIRDHPASGLIDASVGSTLLVVGIGGSRLSKTLGSVAASALHHAPCPVAVMPEPTGDA